MSTEPKPNGNSFFDKANRFIHESLTIKLITIGILILILLIPVNMVQDLIRERTYRQDEAEREVASSWASKQLLGGPVINIPYSDYYPETKVKSSGIVHILPEKYQVDNELVPEVRYRGIFQIPVFNSNNKIEFVFRKEPLKQFENRTYHWEDATIAIGVTDPRGINDVVVGTINGKEIEFQPGLRDTEIYSSGINVPLKVDWNDSASQTINGSVIINMRGTSSMSFVPVGKTSEINMTSSWQHPSFEGNFLPNDRNIDENGFTAHWNVLQYGRSVPQVFTGASELRNESFGVSLYVPVNHYQKSERSAKYAVMFIALTFILFFFSQVINKVRIHPFQYFLVGLALCLFYTLLLSVSEHIGFNLAYLVSVVMILGMILLYLRKIFSSTRFTLITGGVLSGLYIYIFCLLQLEDYSLLIGSIGLFLILALIMWMSLKVDWTGNRTESEKLE